MILNKLFPDNALNEPLASIEIRGLSNDSRAIKKGDAFFIMPGEKFDVLSVIKDIDKQASLLVAPFSLKNKLPESALSTPVIFVKNIDDELTRAADLFYPLEAGKQEIIGITGTNGKTTTSFCIYHVLRALGQTVSLIGTLRYHIDQEIETATHTTPDFLYLRKLLKRISDSGGKFVIIEVSSHAIEQKRVRGVAFSRCIFTNLSRDHLDYHKTMTAYFESKKKLFTLNKDIPAFINIDDPWGRKIYKNLSKGVSYGLNKAADFRAYDVRLSAEGSRFNLERKGIKYSVITSLCGTHNVYNILAAIAVLESYGFTMAKIIRAVESFKTVEGRLELIRKDIFVDYAHTPDALLKVLLSLKNMGYKNIFLVFGCGGERDKGKRKIMGRLGTLHSRKVFITSDNPRGEDPLSICEQIAKGALKSNYAIIVDREKAIKEAITAYGKASKKTPACVLVAGKGHEDYQLISGNKIPFKDSKIIEKITRKTS
jgi:UDP-N-acetylmuramoyl-L-alanyl-D-glutamate--2,6-diaminopimelate ligase